MSRERRAIGILILALVLPACGVGRGGGTLTPTVAPQIPTGLVARTGNHSITLEWTVAPAAAQYTVKRSPIPGGPYVSVATVTATTFSDTGLVNHTPFYYVLSASNAFGESPDSSEVRGVAALRAVRLSGGSNHSAALLQDGTVWTWGLNSSGALGNGLNSDANVPVRAAGLPLIAEISAFGRSNLALDVDGRVWSWGQNNRGQLGNGATTGSSSTPALVDPSSGLPLCSAICGGGDHAMVLGRDGTVWTWGVNDRNQLGVAVPGGITGTPVPVPLPPAIPGVRAISADGAHCMVLGTDGTVWGWGNNEFGELGDPSVVTISSITPVQTFHLTGVVAIAAGNGLSLALRQDGTVWAWGLNDVGQLGNGVGDGTNDNPATPSPLASPVLVNTAAGPRPLSGVIAISARGGQCMALRNDGTVWCWGWNGSGATGNPSVDKYSPYAVQVVGLSPQAIIAASGGTALTASADGTVWGWGSNFHGQLATGTSTTQSVAIQLPNLTSVTGIAAGGSPDPVNRPFGGAILYGSSHGVSLAATGQVWTWGNNEDEQLGDGQSNGLSAQPQLVVKAGPVPLSAVTAVAAGGRHGLALTGGTVWCWGSRSHGQLGDGAVGGTSNVAVQALTNAVAIAGGENHSLALRNDTTVWAWGNNASGQLGMGTTGGTSGSAVQVLTAVATPLTNVVAISAGFAHSLALCGDNTVWAWGDNQFGQLGTGVIGGVSSFAVQVQVLGPPLAPLTGIASISAGSWHNLARTSTGAVWAWGDDTYGQLGADPSITQVYGAFTLLGSALNHPPTGVRSSAGAVPVVDSTGAPLDAVVAVSAGEFHSLALRNDLGDVTAQSVWGWGDSSTGSLGNQDAIGFSPPPGLPFEHELTTPFSPFPVPIQRTTPTGFAPLRGIAEISCAGYTSFARSLDGTVWGCGSNNFSQLGSTAMIDVLIPVTIDP